jgi:mRNA interferase HigB
MHIITRKRLVEFWTQHPDAEPSLRTWEQVFRKYAFRNTHDIRALFPSASFLPGNVVVFNVGGRGKGYRLGVYMRYPKTVYVKWVLTHDEYERRC